MTVHYLHRETVSMGTYTARVFYLTVTVLTLSAVSVGILVYHHNSKVFRNVKTYVNSNRSQSGKLHKSEPKKVSAQVRNTIPKAKPDSSSKASDLALKPSFKMSDNVDLVSVKPFSSDVTASDLHDVQQLLSNYHIVDMDSRTLQMNIHQSVSIILCKNQTDYKNELASIGVASGETKKITLDTGGFTLGNTIVIPLYQNSTLPELANTLGHELTHAILNQNVGNFPSWMNEGLAVTDGIHVQSEVENSVAYQGYAKQMAENVLRAAKSESLWALEPDESKVLSSTATYDLELQDWLAVRNLIQKHGLQAFSDYFYRLRIGESEATAFQRSFGASESAFNQKMTSHFIDAAQQMDSGVTLSFRIPSDFHGNIRMLQHGTQTWVGFHPTAGANTVNVTNSGTLTGAVTPLAPIWDSTPPDGITLYVNINPTTPFTYQGKKVQYAGFAIDYHYGLYSFVNSWVTLNNGQTIYLYDPALFGIQLTSISENQLNPWLTPLLYSPAV